MIVSGSGVGVGPSGGGAGTTIQLPVVSLAAAAVLGVNLGDDDSIEGGGECGVCMEHRATIAVQPCQHAMCGE
jgi:hypothetical protein